MTVQVTVTVPDKLYRHFQWLSEVTGESIENIMAHSLSHYTPSFETEIYVPVEQLSDQQVLELAELQMDKVQGDRLAELSDKRQRTELNAAEETELWSLLHVYQVGLVRKSIGIREAVARGLMKRLDE